MRYLLLHPRDDTYWGSTTSHIKMDRQPQDDGWCDVTTMMASAVLDCYRNTPPPLHVMERILRTAEDRLFRNLHRTEMTLEELRLYGLWITEYYDQDADGCDEDDGPIFMKLDDDIRIAEDDEAETENIPEDDITTSVEEDPVSEEGSTSTEEEEETTCCAWPRIPVRMMMRRARARIASFINTLFR
ncbi:uncharacterized protein LOC143769953 [Ranitomeya variabilis]|uniref:uncharacterized protein LOC143769953 n=1 Tax=Ranitomeya variabilis TaxID=490064 RepID=UPI004056415F